MSNHNRSPNESRRLIPVVANDNHFGNNQQFYGDENKSIDTSSSCSNNQLNGINTWTAAVFIIGEMAGSGVFALPQAVVRASGWIGIVLLIMLCFNAACGGMCLGYCWEILEERYPQHQAKTRNPYSTIAQRALGRGGSILVTCCIQFTMLGTGTVYLLLSSQMLQSLFNKIFPHLNFCMWLFLIAGFLTPLMFLGSPKDFWIVGVGATLTTMCACVLIITQMIIDGVDNKNPVKHRIYNMHDFFVSFGILLFAFGGASVFPTIQNDMNNKEKFSTSVSIAFSVILGIYIPISVGGFLVYGDNVQSNVLLSLTHSYLVSAAEILLAVHLSLAFLIVINPVCQELEELFNVPHSFNWKRGLLRILIMLIMVCVGITIPNFAKILALVGGSTVSLLTFVLPPYIYMKLCDQTNDLWPQRNISNYVRVYLWELICIGVFGGIASTYNGISNLFARDSTTVSCFK